MQIDSWEFYASPLGKRHVLSLGMPPFMVSNYMYVRRKRPGYPQQEMLMLGLAWYHCVTSL